MTATSQLMCLGVFLLCLPAHAQLHKGAALLLPLTMASNLRTNAAQWLVWDSPESRFAIRTGTNLASLVKRATITTNAYPYTNGVVYGISAINSAGVESALAYWPSNRIGALVEQISTNLVTWTDERTVETFTNRPARPQMFLRWVDRTTGWLPPD